MLRNVPLKTGYVQESPMSTHLVIPPQPGKISRQKRESANGHKACVLWITGLSGAGKSTLACAL